MQATSLLAANTEPMLHAWCDALRARGPAIVFDDGLAHDARLAAVRDGKIELVWACGLLTMQLLDEGVELDVVAAPRFPGEQHAVYRSVIVARDERTTPPALGRGRLAVNETGSWSGWHGYRHHLADHGIDAGEHGPLVLTGAHERSLDAVSDGRADLAAIDSSVWDARPDLRAGLRVVATTRDWPAPPLSTRRGLALDLHGLDGLSPTSAGVYEPMLRWACTDPE